MKRIPTFMLLAACLALLAATSGPAGAAAGPAGAPPAGHASPPAPDSEAAAPPAPDARPDLEVPAAAKRYIILLEDPPVATYRGGRAGLAPTAVDAAGGKVEDGKPSVHLDVDSPAARAYVDYLKASQAAMVRRIQRIAPAFRDDDWHFYFASNGFAGRLTPQQAMAVMRLPGVLSVYPEEVLEPEMDSTAPLIHAPDAWDAAGGLAEAGLGARIAVVDTGGDAAHPWFNDTGMPAPPTGFPSATLHDRAGKVLTYPDQDQLVNNKFIGARVFTSEATEQLMSSLKPLALTNGDHGLHVAGIATGRHGTYEFDTGSGAIDIEMGGVAPMAWLFHYVVNDNTPGTLAAYDQMLEDEIDVVNISQGHVGWLIDVGAHHPFAVAMVNAAEAGLQTVASAGNAGVNGRTSLSGGWKYNEAVLAVANTTTTGSIDEPVTVEGADVPERLQNMAAGPRGTIVISSPITADLILADEGGCTTDPKYAGKIAVAERFDANVQSIGPCGYAERATRMKESGAIAIIYVYYDRYVGDASATAIDLPGVAIGSNFGEELTTWLLGGGQGVATISPEIVRGYNDRPDMLSSSSSYGPGLGWLMKPDISAPGTGILSSRVSNTANGPFRFVGALSGTSMSSPHVAGATALLRSIHPDWSAAQLRSALITASSRSVQVGSAVAPVPASPADGGPGRLDLEYAHDPGAFFDPPKAAFGTLDPDTTREVTIAVQSGSDETVEWTLAPERLGGDAEVTVDPVMLTLGPGETDTFTVTIDTTDVEDAEHFGDIVIVGRIVPAVPTIYLPSLVKNHDFERTMPAEPTVEPPPEPTSGAIGNRAGGGASLSQADEPDYKLHVAWFAHVDLPDEKRDVLLVNWTYGATEDYSTYYTDILDELELTYSVWNMGEPGEHSDGRLTHPPFAEMDRHNLVIVNTNMSTESLQDAVPQPGNLLGPLPGMYQYQNHLLGGGSMLMVGQGTLNFWRYLARTRYGDTPGNRNALPDTFPRAWAGPSQNGGCEMCLARYFAGFTPEYTATLSGRLLVPFPMPPDEPELEVVLAPHADADDSVFNYSLDISTGAMAKDGAAGNQYAFASGGVMDGYAPGTSAQVTARLGDVGYAELVLDRYAPAARPLWTYPVSDTQKVVGTYIAGQQTDLDIPWNAMFWGFGLEGVGEGADGTVGRARLLGDAYNFLARNMKPQAVVTTSPDGTARLTLNLGPRADAVVLARAEIDWGNGVVETRALDGAAPVAGLDLERRFAGAELAGSHGPVTVTLHPAAGTAAPIHVAASTVVARERASGF